MPLQNIRLENFRAFNGETSFEFAPITIVTGTNGSGKSSLLDGIRLLNNYVARIKDKFQGNIPESYEIFRFPSRDYIDRIASFEGILNDRAVNPQASFSINYFLKNLEVKATGTLRFIQSENATADSFLHEIEIALEETGEVILCWSVDENGEARLKVDYKFFIESVENEVGRQLKFYQELKRLSPKGSRLSHETEWPVLTSRHSGLKSIHSGLYDSMTNDFSPEEVNGRGNNNWPTLQLFRPLTKIESKVERPLFFKQYYNYETFEKEISDKIKHLESFIYPASIYGWESAEQQLHKQGLLDQEQTFLDQVARWEEKWLRQKFEIVDNKKDAKAVLDYLRNPLNNWVINRLPSRYGDQDLPSEIDPKLLEGLRLFAKDNKFPKGTFNGRMHGGIQLSEKGTFVLEEVILPQFTHLIEKLVQSTKHSYIPSIRAIPQRYFSRKHTATYFEQTIQEFIDVNPLRYKHASEFFNEELKRFGIGDESRIEVDPNVGIITLRINRGEKVVNILDLGFGILQFIPILMRIALSIAKRIYEYVPVDYVSNENDLILIEEPETNLHPAMQSKLADMLIEASRKYEIQFIVESHSEYLIRKLQYHTAKAEIKPEHTQIYYFYSPNETPELEHQVNKINIKEDGSLSNDFGTGFFDEADKVAISIWNMNNAQKN